MASTRRKAAAVAIAIVGVAGLSLAAAAQLTVTSSQLAAGSITVAGCDDAVAVDYTVSGSDVTHVVLNGVAAACSGDDFSITLTNGATVLATVSGSGATGLTLTGSDDNQSATVALATAVPVASVTGVAIVLH